MAGWDLHLNVAASIAKETAVEDYKSFLLGSVLPDCPWTSTQEALTSGLYDEMHTRRRCSSAFAGETDITYIVHKWHEYIACDPIFQGMLTHWLLDYELNTMWNSACYINEDDDVTFMNGKKCSFDEAVSIKHSEVSRYNYLCYGDANPWKSCPDSVGVHNSYKTVRELFGLNNSDIARINININEFVGTVVRNASKNNVEFVLPMTSYDRMVGIVRMKYLNILDALNCNAMR